MRSTIDNVGEEGFVCIAGYRMLPKVRLHGFGCFAIHSAEMDRPMRLGQGLRSSIRRIPRIWLFVLLGICGAAAGQASPQSVPSEELAWHAVAQWGVPYRWGGSDPATGLDCSGLVRWAALQAFGLSLPRRAEEISSASAPIDRGDLSSGDLVFFNTLGRPFSHVGIYLGDGQFIHAPAGRGHVRIESMQLPYWRRRFDGARRLALPGPAPGAARLQATRSAAASVNDPPGANDDAYHGP